MGHGNRPLHKYLSMGQFMIDTRPAGEMKNKKTSPTENSRKRLLDKWANTPAQNPFYRGKTPLKVARMLMRAKWTKRRAA